MDISKKPKSPDDPPPSPKFKPKSPDDPPPKSRSKSKSSSSHKHTLKSRSKSRSKSPPRFKPKSPDEPPPRSRSKSPPRFKPKSPDTPPKSRLRANSSSTSDSWKNLSSPSSSTSAPRHYGEVKLKMPVALSDKIDYNAAVSKKMDKIFQSYDKVEPFTSSFQLSNLFYLYLFKKYKTECLILDQNAKWRMHFSLNLTDHSQEKWFHDFNADQMQTVKKTAKAVSDCIIRGVKIIIIPLGFETKTSGHANLLVYRANTGLIEHFEPHGKFYGGEGSQYASRMLNIYLDHFVKLINKDIKAYNKTLNAGQEKLPKITLAKAHEVCPVIRGVQYLEGSSIIPKNALIEPEGYCEAWTMFFTELCLKNPEMSSREVYEAVMDKTELYENKNDYLRNIIRGYTAFINNKIEKHFSQVFNEPMSSAKIHSMVKSKKDNGTYLDKILEIMEVESGTNFYAKKRGYPLVRYKYTEFTKNISPKTSSSSLKSADRVSPKRKTAKVKASAAAATRKMSPTSKASHGFSLFDKNKMSEIMKSHRESVKLRMQQEKEEKAIERQRIREEKEAEKQRIKEEKALAKSEKSKAKTTPKAKTAKSKTVIFEEIPDEKEF